MPSAKSEPKLPHSWHFDAIGTKWVIDSSLPLERKSMDGITEIIASFDGTYSRFRDDSLVGQMAQSAGEYDFPENVIKLIELYKKLYEVTDGSVTPLVGNALVDAGYDKDYSLVPGKINAIPEWDDIMTWEGNHVTTKKPLVLDFGAAGKGYLVDIISEYLEHRGHDRYTVDASGDMRVRGAMETVGLENPFDTSSVIGVVKLENASLCGSAVNRRSWGDWHHIIDGKTAKPTREVVSTWVVASTTLEADGLATASFFVDLELLADRDIQFVRLHRDGHIEQSSNFVGELYL